MSQEGRRNIKEEMEFLYRQFPNYSREIIDLVAEECQYNIQNTAFNLYGMMNQRFPAPTYSETDEKSRIITLIKDGWKVMVLMRGLPGSGKTHLSHEVFQASNISFPPSDFIFSTDDFFNQNGRYKYNINRLGEAHEWNQMRCNKAMLKGFSPIIIDNTNLVAWEMKIYCIMAIEYGYVIEILEANTDWACDPSILAIKNKHNVPKDKLIKMLNKFDRSITTLSLLKEFGLKCSHPQKRMFPPSSIRTEENYNQAQGGYVRTDLNDVDYNATTTRGRGVKTKDLIRTDLGENIDFMLKEKHKNQPPIMEYVHRFDPKEDEVKPKNSEEEKQINNNDTPVYPTLNELSAQNKSLSKIKNIQSEPNINQSEFKSDESKTVQTDSKKSSLSEQKESDSKPLGDLIDLLGDNTSSVPSTAISLYGAFPLMPTSAPPVNQKEPHQSTSDANLDLKSTLNQQNHLTAWGTNEKALQSWETVLSTKSPIGVDFDIYKKIGEASQPRTQHSDKTTNTNSDDFRFALNCPEADGVSVLNTKSRTINKSGVAITKCTPRKKITVDIGCMTEEEETNTNPENNAGEVEEQLKNLFPKIPMEHMLEIYDKCKQNLNWTIELLLDTPYDPKLEIEKKKVNVQSEKESSPTTKPNNEIESLKKDLEEKIKLQKIELKKQVEENITFNKEHYSDYLWGLKNQRQGTSQTPPNISPQVSIDETQDDDFEEEVEEIVEINLGQDLVKQLEKHLGNEDFVNQNLPTNVQMPISLVKQIHALYLQSLCQQIEEQNNLINKDEEYAHKLNNEQHEAANGPNLSTIMDEQLAMFCQKKENEQYKTMAPQTLAMVMKKNKLYESFPTVNKTMIDQLWNSHNNNYDEVVDTLIANVNQKYIVSNGNVREDPISDEMLRDMVQNKAIAEQFKSDKDYNNAQQYRDDAVSYGQKSQHLQNVAQQYHRKGMGQVAVFYSKLAEDLRRKRDFCNQKATFYYLSENFHDDTLDLHYLKVAEAVISLDIFIDRCVLKLVKPTDYFIITGQGNRSVGGIPKLKPAVISRLRKRKIAFTFINPGLLKMKLHKNIAMTNDLKSNLKK